VAIFKPNGSSDRNQIAEWLFYSDEKSSGQVALEHSTVVIGIPTFNEERFVLETLKSVRSQTHDDFLVVISDNGSTDKTAEICQAFCQADHRFVVIAQPRNLGAAANFQWLLKNTRSPYFMWLGAHDLISVDFLEKHLCALSDDPSLALSFANSRCIDQNSIFTGEKDGGNYHRIKGTPAQRYRRMLQRMGPAEPINNLFRRAALYGVEFTPVAALDRMILCQAAFWGQFNKIDEPLYHRRFITDRDEGPVARLVRVKGRAVKNRGYIESLWEFQRQFRKLEKSWKERALLGMAVWSRYSKRIRKDIKAKIRHRLTPA
jgi:glycosyltransferase involved in cell wall biosynthesis